jgi:hypothetical protein
MRLIDLPAAAHVRNAKTNATTTTPRTIAQRAPKPRTSWIAPSAAQMAAAR